MSRRICWPNPNVICLTRGCCYCKDNSYRSNKIIEDYIKSLNNDKIWKDYVEAKQMEFYGGVDIR